MRFLLIVFALAGCGGAESPTQTPDSGQDGPEEAAPVCAADCDYDPVTGGFVGWHDCDGRFFAYDGGTVPSCATWQPAR